MMGDYLFETTDRNGDTVRLARIRWEMHIVEKHGEVERFIEQIKAVIHSPGIGTLDRGGAYHLSTFGAVSGSW